MIFFTIFTSSKDIILFFKIWVFSWELDGNSPNALKEGGRIHGMTHDVLRQGII